ncbi:hypothetical protein BH10CYA1_BH10CYA1_24940 [soil metagenome]
MSVYFVYRSHYGTPNLNHLKKFDDNSVLEWFQKHWREWAEHVDDTAYVLELFGCDVYGFASIFDAIDQEALSPPKSMKDVEKFLTDHLYVEGDMRFGPDSIQVLTDDDELQLAYYFFDDNYLKANGEKASFLVHQEWKLPESFSSRSTILKEDAVPIHPAGSGSGTTYCAFLSYYDGGNLDDIDGPICINGIRLPNLVKYLQEALPSASPDSDSDWPFELRLIRSQLPERIEHANITDLERVLRQSSRCPIAKITNATDWTKFGNQSLSQVKADFEMLSQSVGANETSAIEPPLIQVDEHVAQISINTETWDKVKLYQRWILFDDLWAGNNSDLANSILCYAKRWDVLS